MATQELTPVVATRDCYCLSVPTCHLVGMPILFLSAHILALPMKGARRKLQTEEEEGLTDSVLSSHFS